MKNQPTYRQARFIKGLLSQMTLGEFPQETQLPLHHISKQLERVIEKHQEETTIILLLNGGVEKKQENGTKYFAMPDVPERKNQTDDQYKGTLKKHFELVGKINNEMDLLNNKPCGVEIAKVFTAEEYTDLTHKVAGTELANCKDLLVKVQSEETK